jgi:hypothetical protein
MGGRLIAVGSSERTRSIMGAGFTGASAVLVNGTTRPTTLISPTELRFSLTGTDVALPGELTVTVSGPGAELGSLTIRVVDTLYSTVLPLVRR